MEKIIGLITKLGKIEGRDAIYLDRIIFNSETDLTLTGDFNVNEKDHKFKMNFKGITFLSIIELDFDKREQMESLATIKDSEKIKEFKSLDHSSKINDKHIETIVRQMLRKRVITFTGDSKFLVGEQIEESVMLEENDRLTAAGKQIARGTPILLGITKASLATESFITPPGTINRQVAPAIPPEVVAVR